MTATLTQDVPIERSTGYWAGVWSRLRRDPVSLACMAVLAVIVGACVLAPWLTSHDPAVGSVILRLKPVGTPGHILGTDELGRDMLTRLLYGGRTSLVMGAVPVVLALLIGGSLGMVAGFVGGRVNTAIMRSVDVVFAFPSILLAVAIAGAMGAGIVNALLALTIVLIQLAGRYGLGAGYQAASAAGALLIALALSSLIKALMLKHLLKAPVSNWRWALVYAAAPAVVVGYAFTFMPEWIELLFGVPAVLATYAFVIWRRGFGEEDKVLFRKQVVPDPVNDLP